jgi:predicted hotdog family 3-hydroxylacyl-ACP dehydratase
MAPLPSFDHLLADAGPEALVDAIRELEDEVARAQAAQARLTDRLARLRPHDAAGLVSHARRLSPAHATRRIGLAKALVHDLPHTLAAMESGALSEWRATLIARETACLSPDDRAVVDQHVAAHDADGAHPFDGWGDRRLVAEVRQVVAEVDVRAVVDRRSRAEADRRVTLRPAPDTMAQLSSLLPAAQGVAVWASLVRAADQARAAGDPRSRGQVMADTLVERVTGQASAAAVPVAVHLVVSDETLLGRGSAPAWLQEHGPVTADAARDLTRAATDQAHAALRRLYSRPDTGALVAMDSTSRTFPKSLALFLDLRDRTCRTAWCDGAIRHHDHATDHSRGGPTSAANGQGLCEQCNHIKQAAGWRATPITGPPGTRHTVETTLPTGHTVVSTAPRAPTPARLRAASRLELRLTNIALEYAA